MIWGYHYFWKHPYKSKHVKQITLWFLNFNTIVLNVFSFFSIRFYNWVESNPLFPTKSPSLWPLLSERRVDIFGCKVSPLGCYSSWPPEWHYMFSMRFLWTFICPCWVGEHPKMRFNQDTDTVWWKKSRNQFLLLQKHRRWWCLDFFHQ